MLWSKENPSAPVARCNRVGPHLGKCLATPLQWAFGTERSDRFTNLAAKFHQCLVPVASDPPFPFPFRQAVD